MSRSKASMLAILTALLTATVMLGLPYSPAIVVQTTLAANGDWARTVLASGTVGYRQRPCLAVQPGIVSGVHVQPGQCVQKGELLFQMDTTSQEKALSAIKNARYQQKEALLAANEAVAAIAIQKELEWKEMEAELMASVEAAQIRASDDGIVETVYIQPGEYISGTAMLGTVREEEKSILVLGRTDALTGMAVGMDAIITQNGAFLCNATLQSISAPETSGMQQLTFQPDRPDALKDCVQGARVTVEIIKETLQDCTLIPLSAVDVDGRVWFVKDGYACSETADVLFFDEHTAVVDRQWEGRRIILHPAHLREGSRIKEAMAQ